MRPLFITLLLTGIASTALPVQAHDPDACLSIETDDSLVCRHYFEGTNINLPVRAALDGFGTACERFVVNVMQRHGTLLAELGEPREFNAEQCSTLTSIALDLPDVRSEVDILVQFSLRESEHAAEAIAIRIYPDTLLDPLVKFAAQHSLVVFDDDGVLTEFLDGNEIDYLQRFETKPGVAIALLVEPNDPELLLEGRGFDGAVIFREKIFDLPQVRAVSTNGRTRVYVEMPLLGDLHKSPLAQKALLDIIRLATNPLSTDRG